jgi:pimeloyl-ACP methyl ester carboxylesterase
LSVPLDYFNGTYPDERVSIAIAKLPARVPIDDPRYGGPILLNPGGPGGPGALFAIGIAESLRNIVDPTIDPTVVSEDARYYDLIGFDPRGIGWTQPVANCMPDLPSSWSWTLRETTEGILGSSDAALGRLWSMEHAYGTSCKQAEDDEDGPDIKRYMSTAFVARDMLEITEKHALYVSKNLSQLPKSRPSRCVGYTPGEAKLQYWGFSYGTYLGSTFASMFPDRVGRVILDGVVSWYDYSHSLGNGSLTDNEKAMESFHTFCQQAGPSKCALSAENATISDIKERFHDIVESLYHNPLPLNTPYGPEILTWSDIKILIFSSLYQTQGMFPIVAELLAAVEAGHGAIIDQLSGAYHHMHTYSCSANSSNSMPTSTPGVTTMAILCGDGIDQTNLKIDEFAEYWQLLDSMAPAAGSYWAMLRMRCAAWKIRASYSFQGPFGGNTSHPILFLSNTADPVTPLRSGRLMHSLFPGSGILVQDSAGHCSISTPTPCTLAHIKAYFQTGVLPPPETVCVPPTSPFSLNSTDPKSPFFDPSLGSANVVALEFDEFDEEQQYLHDAGVDVQRFATESDTFAFQNLPGLMRVKNVMKMAVRNL